MAEFRAHTDSRFNIIDKRFNDMDRKFEELKEEFRIHTGAILDEFRAINKVTLECMQHIESKMVTREEF